MASSRTKRDFVTQPRLNGALLAVLSAVEPPRRLSLKSVVVATDAEHTLDLIRLENNQFIPPERNCDASASGSLSSSERLKSAKRGIDDAATRKRHPLAITRNEW